MDLNINIGFPQTFTMRIVSETVNSAGQSLYEALSAKLTAMEASIMGKFDTINASLDQLDQTTNAIADALAAAKAEYDKLAAELLNGVTGDQADAIAARLTATGEKLTPIIAGLQAIGKDPENPVPPPAV